MRFQIAAMAGAMLLASGSAGAQHAAEPSFSGERMKADISFLADDLLEGRDTGTRGYDIAARYVASQFAAMGLRPGNGGSWFQNVPFAKARVATTAPARLTLGTASFDNGTEVLFGSNPLFPTQDFSADVVFAGYGLDAPAQGFDDYAGLDVRGKIVVVLWGFPPGSPSEVAAHLNSEKSKMAQARGAIGLVQVVTPTLERIYGWERQKPAAKKPTYRWIGTDGRPFLNAPDLQIEARITPKAAEVLFAGAPRSVAMLMADSEKPKLAPKGFALRQRMRVERTMTVERIESPNVVAMIPGSDPTLAAETIAMIGHLDHDGIVEPVGGDSIMNGAMDNASGVATLLEAARGFVASGVRPKRSILFAAVTAEEDGLLGADYLARHPLPDAKEVVGVVNLDMPILTYDFEDVIAFGAEHSTIGSVVERAAERAGVSLSPDPYPEENSFVRSDHYMFVKQGVPAVYLATGVKGPGKSATEDFVAKHYHRVSDDMAKPFDWVAAAKFARINYLIARELADAPQSPRWYAGNFFGNTFAKDAPKAPR